MTHVAVVYLCPRPDCKAWPYGDAVRAPVEVGVC